MSKAVGFAPRVIFVAIIAVVMTFFNNAQLCAQVGELEVREGTGICLLYTSPSPRDS